MITETEYQIPSIIKENPKSFIRIPKHDLVIAIEETHKNKDTSGQLEGLAQENLEMPSILSFMAHRQNVLQNKELVYADGTPVERKLVKDLQHRLSSDCWTRLNARFIEEKTDWNVNWYIETDLKFIEDKLKGKSLNEAKKLEKEQVYDMLSIPISPQRVKCALLSLETLRRLIKIYESKNG